MRRTAVRGAAQAATSSGFGAVFTHVKHDDSAKIEYFDVNGRLLYSAYPMFRPSRARGALLLVAFSVLASTATASAECAWVLWMQVALSTGGPDQLTPLDAHRSKMVCDQAKLQAQRVARDAERKVGAPEPVLLCLPDTIDPRGPKGKWVTQMALLAALEEFVGDHRPHGTLACDVTEPAWNGYRLTARRWRCSRSISADESRSSPVEIEEPRGINDTPTTGWSASDRCCGTQTAPRTSTAFHVRRDHHGMAPRTELSCRADGTRVRFEDSGGPAPGHRGQTG